MKKQNEIEQKIAEQIANEEFNTERENHEFSQTYTNRKEKFLSSLDEDKKSKWTTKKILVAAAIFMIVIPTTIVTANEIYQWYVTQKEYKLTMSVKGSSTNDSVFYKLNLGYLPDNMIGDEESGKYSYRDTPNMGGFSFVLWKVKDQADFTELNTKDYQEVTYGDNKGYLIHKEGFNVNQEGGFARIVYLFFEKEGYVVEAYVGNDVPNNDLEKVMSNISLKETDKEKATFSIDYETYKKELENEPVDDGLANTKLAIDSPNIYKIGESVEANPLDELAFDFTVDKVEVLNNIKEFDATNFHEYPIERMKEKQLLSEDLVLQSYTQQIIRDGNGETTVDEIVGEKRVTPKFVYVTATIDNKGNSDLVDLSMQNSPQLVKTEGNYFVPNRIVGEGVDFESYSGEVDYLDSHGEGTGYYRMPTIKGKEKRVIHFGYFIDDDQLDKMLLPVFNYSNPEDLSDSEAKWIDIRQ